MRWNVPGAARMAAVAQGAAIRLEPRSSGGGRGRDRVHVGCQPRRRANAVRLGRPRRGPAVDRLHRHRDGRLESAWTSPGRREQLGPVSLRCSPEPMKAQAPEATSAGGPAAPQRNARRRSRVRSENRCDPRLLPSMCRYRWTAVPKSSSAAQMHGLRRHPPERTASRLPRLAATQVIGRCSPTGPAAGTALQSVRKDHFG